MCVSPKWDKVHIKSEQQAGCQWLRTIILAAHEVEIRRITVQSPLGKIALKTLSQKYPMHKKKKKKWLAE
jgi:hypothetical protein